MKRFALFILASAGLLAFVVSPGDHATSVLQPLARVHGPVKLLKRGVSTNWGGYADGSNLDVPVQNSVTFVSGSWIVPTLNACTPDATYSAGWVGIDGYDNGTVEQLGTESDCSSGIQSNYAWFEMYPQPGFLLNPTLFPVVAGDVISASVEYQGAGNFLLSIDSTNATWPTGGFSIVKKSNKAQRTTAEWIVEAPGQQTLPLANFGTMHFSSAQATIGGLTRDFLDAAFDSDRLTLIGDATATPTPTSSSTFDVTFGNSTTSDRVYAAAVSYSFNRKQGGSLTVTISLVDNLGDPVDGAAVNASTTGGGALYGANGLTTNANGNASFVISSPGSGTYHTDVTGVSSSGRSWDGVSPPNAFKVR